MANIDDIAAALNTIVQLMVDRPRDVRTKIVNRDGSYTLHLTVHPLDVGKIVGKMGRTARSLRTILAAMGLTNQLRIALDVQNGGDVPPAERR